MKKSPPLKQERSIVLFDGVCHLCLAAVRFIIDRDPSGRFAFASLQSDTAARLLGRALPEGEAPSTIILVENGSCYTQSTAALRIARRLRFPWPALYVFIVLPSPIRDVIYNFTAARRYRWFGKDTACMVPTPEIRSRFIEEE
ncbi:hypothetical protein J41TS12_29140 [Paenibacillus antibioticophila]|uniref:Thiol-disulfide oxidoreductase DCC family protein n=1 Tax=Paenibacillus antibioticophila TaxID=1274374 RepID=A0A920CHS1_9BACL|nr:DCC1-like thiol-disulfide oxidoreductase family protein [Paenibacillus antibioticophila]GIO38053.1 hypothetical protein J41TS12_29140 [Paenibacillus antibioticophila]